MPGVFFLNVQFFYFTVLIISKSGTVVMVTRSPISKPRFAKKMTNIQIDHFKNACKKICKIAYAISSYQAFASVQKLQLF